MGICSSCCRRRKKSPENEPLLNRDSADPSPSLIKFEKAADVFAALQARKLPTQNQIDRILMIALKSDALDVSSLGKAAYGPLSTVGKRVISDVRDVLETVLQLGLEKNCEYFNNLDLQETNTIFR